MEKRATTLIKSKSEARLPQALTATLAIALMLAATRWGSYIGVAPLFLTDLLIAGAIVHRVLGNAKYGTQERIGGDSTKPGILITILLGYVVTRMLTSFDFAFGMDWLRDAMPFLYAALAFVSASSFARSTELDRKKTMKILWWALIAHLVWVSAIVWSGVDTSNFPSFPRATTPILSLRPDIDMAFLGVTAGLLLRRMIRRERRGWSFIGLALALATATQFGTRAGLISLAVALAAVYVLTFAAEQTGVERRRNMFFLAPVVLAIALAAVANTTGGERLFVSVMPGVIQSGNVHELSAAGTQAARELTWGGVTDWTLESGTRTIFGSGFGNNFLEQSGVLSFLQGTEYLGVRSPHSWIVGVFARMGIAGVVICSLIVLALLRKIVQERVRIGQDELLTTSALTIVAIIPVAMLGVVLESPFGAIPFWWFSGIIFSLAKSKVGKTEMPKKLTRPYKKMVAAKGG